MTERKQEQQGEPEELEEEAPAAQEPNGGVKNDPALLERAFDRLTKAGPGALQEGSPVPRKRLTFVMDAGECLPGVFVDATGAPQDFTLTLESLSSAQELKALQGVQDPGEVVLLLTRESIVEMNGAPVLGDRRDFLWECLGPGGRQIVLAMYQQIGSATPGGLGKARSTVSTA